MWSVRVQAGIRFCHPFPSIRSINRFFGSLGLPRLPSNLGSEGEENRAAHCQQDKCGSYEVRCMSLHHMVGLGLPLPDLAFGGACICGVIGSLSLSLSGLLFFHPSHHPVKYEEVKSCAWVSKCWPVMGSITMFGLLFAFSNNRSRAWRG